MSEQGNAHPSYREQYLVHNSQPQLKAPTWPNLSGEKPLRKPERLRVTPIGIGYTLVSELQFKFC